MIIECLIKRDGPTHLTIDKFNYCFKENPDFGGAVVCDVTNDAHASQLLAIGMYRKYEGAKPSVSPDPEPLPGMEQEPVLTTKPDPLLKSTEKEQDPDHEPEPEQGDLRDEGYALDSEAEGEAEHEEVVTDSADEDMSEAEQDAALLNMVDGGMSYAKVGEVMGKSKSWVGNRVKLLRKEG